MSKHEELTEDEFRNYVPPQKAIKQIEKFATIRGIPQSDLKILDWGCGRGRFVLWLREHGMQAYGVDIDPEPIQNGLSLFHIKGYPEKSLSVLSPEGQAAFPDGFFDFIMTDNVIEHVSQIEKVTAEISRLTAKGGGGYHIFPAQRQFIEGHLFMPFVHWVPEGKFRKALIGFFVHLGKEPHWKELRNVSLNEKVGAYYKYSTDHIFYRPFQSHKKRFENEGFTVQFRTIDNPAVARNKILGPLSKFRVTRSIINWSLLTFKQVEIFLSNKR